ncbi:MAG TPA: PD-(D/E)XK nuclease family protein, partial [Propionicimonas sp.]
MLTDPLLTSLPDLPPSRPDELEGQLEDLLLGEVAAAEAAPGCDPAAVVADEAVRRSPGLSPSRANDYLQCPLLFRLRVIDRLPEPPSPAAVRGTLVHAVLERLFDAPAGRRTLQAARALVEPCWDTLLRAEPGCATVVAEGGLQAWFDDAGTLLETYFTLEDPNRLQPADRELTVRTQLEDGPELRGIVDRIDVAPDGAIRVVDYKTGRSPRVGFESAALFQMRFYALVLSRLRGRVPAMLQLVYLGDGTLLRHQPEPGELALTEQRVRAIWSGIVETARQDS